MAGLMLASAFSVAEAQTVVKKYETSKTYWLSIASSEGGSADATKVIAVVSDPQATNYGQLVSVEIDDLDGLGINAVKAATWSIVFTEPTDGTAPKFTYVNKATGLTLSLDADAAKQAGATGTPAYVKGGVSQFLNTTTLGNGEDQLTYTYLRAFYNANDALYLKEVSDKVDFYGDDTANELLLCSKEDANTDGLGSLNAIAIAPAQPEVYQLSANDLNTQLGKVDLDYVPDDQKYFNLYFNQDVTSGAETNLFAATPLKASPLYYTDNTETTTTTEETSYPSPFVRLTAKDMDGAYITVDTAYHAGTETVGRLPKFTYAKDSYEGTNNVPRYSESSAFAFAYDAYNGGILIKVHGYYTKKTGANYNKAAQIKGDDGNPAYTYWGYDGDGTKETATATLVVNDAFVRLATLASVRELTVSNNDDGANGTYSLEDWKQNAETGYAMATTVTMSVADQTFAPTSVADGLYLIKLHTSGYKANGDKRTDGADGDYLIASLGGNFGYAEQAKRQNYDHMPAAQWLVQKQGTSSTAPIKIINREFFDQKADDNTYFGVNGNAIQAFTAGAANRVMFTSGAFQGDTLEFIPVSDASKKDAYLGYKYVTPEQASVETYYFNYLSGLALDKGLNTPSDKDSLVRVDENGDKIALRLVPVVKDDSYGQQFDEKETGVAKLIRNAYYIEAYDNLKFAADGRSRYLSYEPATKKYVMSLVPELFFLKENNDIDGTHYYALVKANTYSTQILDKGSIWLNDLNDDGKDDAWEGWASTKLENLRAEMYPAVYAGKDIRSDADIWTFEELKNTDEKTVTIANGSTSLGTVKVKNPLSQAQRDEVEVIFYDEDGEPVIADASKAIELYAYMADKDSPVISLKPVTTKETFTGGAEKTVYYAMNPDGDLYQHSIWGSGTGTTRPTDFAKVNSASTNTKGYASNRVSVDDNTLDLFIAQVENIQGGTWADELRVSAFEVAKNNSPLYRRFNGAAPETYGTAANAPLNLKFYRYNNNAEYLFENQSKDNAYREGLKDNSISFLGVNNAYQFPENETRSYTMFVDTAYVRYNTRMPQYLIGIRPDVVPGDTIWCNATSAHHHETLADSLACDHTVFTVGFTRAMYLFNAQDSIDAKNYDYQGKIAQGAQNYTRLAFKDAAHAQDTLYILKPGVTNEQLINTNFKDGDLFSNKIALNDNKHKNVVFSFRLIDDENNRFLIESETEEGGKAVLNKDLKNVSIAPRMGGWVKIQNGVPVIAHYDDFNEAIAQAEIFDVNDEIQYDATANDEVAVESVKVIAGNGQVTIMGAAGKNVTITTVLGKTVVAKTIRVS